MTRGRKRAGIFYKADSYDRSSDIGVNRRFSVGLDYKRLNDGTAVAQVFDADEVIHTTKAVKIKNDADYKERQAAQDEVVMMAKNWVSAYYPNWEDAAAYWDDGEAVAEEVTETEPTIAVERGQWYRVKDDPKSAEAQRIAGQLVGAVEVDSHKTMTVSVYTMDVFENRSGVAIRIPLGDLTNR